jgi:hypothetical protein
VYDSVRFDCDAPDVRLYLSSIAENVLTKGTTLKVEVPVVVEVVLLQLVDAKLVELVEVVDDELVLLEVFELVFDVVEVEEEEEEEAADTLEELEEVVELAAVEEGKVLEVVVEELDLGAERIAYAPTPAIATITTTIKAIARGASAPLF